MSDEEHNSHETNSFYPIFGDFLTQVFQPQGQHILQYLPPPTDIFETDAEVTVFMQLPGVPTDSIDIDFYNNIVTVRGERPRPFDMPDGNSHRLRQNEIHYGLFERKLRLPMNVVSEESVSIRAENGMLIIIIDKTHEARNRFSVRVNN